MRVIEKNKKDSSVQIKEGTIYINAETIVFKPGAFMVYADQQNQDSSASQEQDLYGLFLIVIIFEELK